MAEVLPYRNGLVSLQGVNPLSPLVFSQLSSSAGARCHGTNVAKVASVCLSPNHSASGVLVRVHQEGLQLILVALFWPARVWFADLVSLLEGSPWEILNRRELLFQDQGTVLNGYFTPEWRF